MIRRTLDGLYLGAAYLAALFLVGTLVMVLTAIAGRWLNFHVPGTDAYAGYCMAASGFLALAHTLKRGEHIRVNLFLERSGPKARHALELISHGMGAFFAGALAFYSVRLAWQSHAFNDISQGNDATPLWIPQVAMAVGATVLAVAMLDDFILHIRGKALAKAAPDELKAIE